ncbi:MAG: hypothetical protein ACHBN1_06640 [Heteroscytonema crispum UTEX LB 1556]
MRWTGSPACCNCEPEGLLVVGEARTALLVTLAQVTASPVGLLFVLC